MKSKRAEPGKKGNESAQATLVFFALKPRSTEGFSVDDRDF